jgi:hypothetical protein
VEVFCESSSFFINMTELQKIEQTIQRNPTLTRRNL